MASMRTRPAPEKGAPASQPVFRWLLVGVLGIHAVVGFTQSILAGAYLSGSLTAMQIHGLLGSALTMVVMLQGLMALLFWFPGRGPWWPLVATVVLFFVEALQVGFGYARSLELHVPLGVALIATLIGMFVWSLRWRPRPARSTGGDPPHPPSEVVT